MRNIYLIKAAMGIIFLLGCFGCSALMDCDSLLIAGPQNINISEFQQIVIDIKVPSIADHFKTYTPHVINGVRVPKEYFYTTIDSDGSYIDKGPTVADVINLTVDSNGFYNTSGPPSRDLTNLPSHVKGRDGIIEWITDGVTYDLNRVDIHLFDSTASAGRYYELMCAHGFYRSDMDQFQLEGTSTNRYCMSYVEEHRRTSVASCGPSGDYNSFVLLQKSNIVIRVHQYSTNKSRRWTERQINKLTPIFLQIAKEQ